MDSGPGPILLCLWGVFASLYGGIQMVRREMDPFGMGLRGQPAVTAGYLMAIGGSLASASLACTVITDSTIAKLGGLLGFLLWMTMGYMLWSHSRS